MCSWCGLGWLWCCDCGCCCCCPEDEDSHHEPATPVETDQESRARRQNIARPLLDYEDLLGELSDSRLFAEDSDDDEFKQSISASDPFAALYETEETSALEKSDMPPGVQKLYSQLSSPASRARPPARVPPSKPGNAVSVTRRRPSFIDFKADGSDDDVPPRSPPRPVVGEDHGTAIEGDTQHAQQPTTHSDSDDDLMGLQADPAFIVDLDDVANDFGRSEYDAPAHTNNLHDILSSHLSVDIDMEEVFGDEESEVAAIQRRTTPSKSRTKDSDGFIKVDTS